MAAEFRGQNVVFLAITDDNVDRLKAFLAKQPLDAVIGIDTADENFKSFGVVSIPHTVVIGKDGNVIGATSPENVTSAVLREILTGGKPSLQAKTGVPADLDWDDNLIDWKDGIPATTYAIVKPIKTYTAGCKRTPTQIVADGLVLEALVQVAYETNYYLIDWRAPKDDRAYRVAVRVSKERKTYLLPFLRQTIVCQFAIRARWEKQEREVYVIKRVKGQKPPAESVAQALSGMMKGKITLRHQPIKKLCDELTSALAMIVVDESGLTGFYDFELPYEYGQPEQTLDALSRYGLELVRSKRRVPILVVEPAA
jgi:uncharacterized protein (TIGR03435 family)